VYGGLAFGPALGETILDRFDFDVVWLVSAGLAAVAAVVGLATRDVARLQPATAIRPPLVQRSALAAGLVLFLGLVGLAGFAAFVPLYVSEIGLDDSSGILFLYGALILVIRIVGARLPDRLGPLRAGSGATGLGAVGMFVMAAWSSPAGLVAGTIVFACGMSLLYPAILTLALTGVAEEERASVVGTVSSFFDLSQGLGAFILGAIAAFGGYRGAFVGGGVFAVAGLVVLRSGLDPRTRRPGPVDPAAAELARQNLEPDPP
jgi:predicted MFS family arabinose efflux permease